MNLISMMKNASKIKSMIKEQQKALEKTVITSEVAAGDVKLQMNGQYQALSLTIEPNLLNESADVVQEILLSCINDATTQVTEQIKTQMANPMSDMADLDGLKDLLKGDDN